MLQSPKFQTFTTLLLLSFTLLTGNACHKTEEEVPPFITETEAAEIIETAVAGRSGGIAFTVPELAKTLFTSTPLCDTLIQTNLHFSKVLNTVSYDQELGMGWRFFCNNLGPDEVSTGFIGNGSFHTDNWTSSYLLSNEMSIDDLNAVSTVYTAFSKITRTGEITGMSRSSEPTFHCMTTLSFSTLKISKSTYQITGGSASISVIATADNGEKKAWTGALTIYSDGKATTLINGQTHTFSLE